MARRRYLSTSISTDKAVARLADERGDFAALLYTWMLPHAEDDCSIESDHEQIVATVVPLWLKRRRFNVQAQVDSAIEGMLALGLLVRDEDGGYFFPPESFYKYQSYVKPDRRRKTPQNIELPRKTTPPSDAIEKGENVDFLGIAAKTPQIIASINVSDPVPVPISGSAIADPPPRTRARAKPLSAICPELIEQFTVDFPLANVPYEAEQFRDYCLSGKGKYTDHIAAFRKWCRKANEDARRNGRIQATGRVSAGSARRGAASEFDADNWEAYASGKRD